MTHAHHKPDIEDTQEIDISEIFAYEKKSPQRTVFAFVKYIGIIFAVVIALGLFGYHMYQRIYGNEISIVPSTELIFSGHNGAGQVDASFAPENAAIEILEFKKQFVDEETAQKYDELIRSIACSFSQSDHLSNGMTITYACRYNATLAKELDITMIDTSRMYQVTGLAKALIVNPFEDIQTNWIVENDVSVVEIIPNGENRMLETQYSYAIINDTTAMIYAYLNQDKLDAYGFSNTELTYMQRFTVESRPYQTNDVNTTTKLNEAILTIVDNDLSSCNQSFSFGKQSIPMASYTIANIHYIGENQYQVEIHFENIYTEGVLANYYTFITYYQGTITYQNGNYTFTSENTHGCLFDGRQNRYYLE